ncbi:MAG TPA: NAD(P)H-binding protein [Thermoanaerobaculia bacterium]
MIEHRFVFVAGGTGYIGRSVIPRLLERGHSVKALVRPGSERRIPAAATPVMGDALDRKSFDSQVRPCDTYLQLVGVSHPSPSKAEEFRRIDLTSARASAAAARQAGVAHFVYLSVAQPAPAMKAYVEARAAGETAIREAGLNATFLRPWYVLGPGHRWPALLWPGYWLAERFPPTRETARRIGLVTLSQMTAAIVRAVETPATGVRNVEVPEIRKARL